MAENRVPVEFIGLKLPSSNPMASYKRLTKQLTKREIKAMDDIDDALVALVRIPGARIAFRLGPNDGLSQWYEWGWQNNYLQNVTASDARIILERLNERFMFRRLDDPRSAAREAEYPPPSYIELVQVTRGPRQHRLGRDHVRFIRRLRRVARGDLNLHVIGQRVMEYRGPDGS